MSTHDTRALLALISLLLSHIWRDGHRYQNGGVMLADFTPVSMQQGDLFAGEQQAPHNKALIQVIDMINGCMGKLYFGARGGVSGVDDEAGADQPTPRHLLERDPRGEGIVLES